MPPKVLRRCSICKNWGAVMLVNDPQAGKLYLCYACWKKRTDSLPSSSVRDQPLPEDKEENTGKSTGETS
jgi:hypothetical protein